MVNDHYAMTSIIRGNFDDALADVDLLLDQHREQMNLRNSCTYCNLDVYKRASVILLVTAWESFVEDAFQHHFTTRVRAASSPADISTTFEAVAQYWLNRRKLSPKLLMKWSGDEWRTRICERFNAEISQLNTPSSTHIRSISKRYLGQDITEHWHWSNTTSNNACERLDALITLRGRLVHRSKDIIALRSAVKITEARRSRDLVVRLVDITEDTLDRAELAPFRRQGV